MESFNISKTKMKQIMRNFHLEMKRGLAGKKSSLKMIPTYVSRPTGREKGKFIALDFGGTNFRILKLELKGNGCFSKPGTMRFALRKKEITGTADEFFGFIAGCVKAFIEKYRLKDEINLGFTFSFPIKQTAVASGTLICWTKGFKTKGVIGKDVVKLLEEALSKKGVNNVRISALANDTVGTLVAKSYEDPDCDVGVIIGTGTNACYPEKTLSGMIINTEWGNFDKLKKTAYDRELDKRSDRPGEQILEKMVSGMYLGEIARLIIKDNCGRSVFKQKGGFKTEYMSIIESDRSPALAVSASLFKKTGFLNSTLNDRRKIKEICEIVSRRGARISAACMAAIITEMDPRLSKKHTIAIDGTVYEKHPTFSKNINLALKEIFGNSASRIKATMAKDGSGIGAAIIAAVASHIA